jgi:hypothetical protein
MEKFYSIDAFKITLNLKARDDPDFSKQFSIYFDRLKLIANDIAEIQPFDFEFVAFRFSDNVSR